MASVPILRELTIFSVYFYHTEEWTESNQLLLEILSEAVVRRAVGRRLRFQHGAWGV